MADDRTTPETTTREAQEALEKQVAQMKREINKINRMLAGRAEETAEEVSGWYNGATERASRATQALRTQAQTVSEAVRENPGTVSSAMFLGGIVGFAIGCLFSQATSESHRRWY
ncbi:hypothetical protein [Mesorhizobium sp. 1B3]|uniref:hypothetical protein n=1 Tax=Mesorhizobium sp. 1B3 TaxID=3243599 RepID=UPI003D96423A